VIAEVLQERKNARLYDKLIWKFRSRFEEGQTRKATASVYNAAQHRICSGMCRQALWAGLLERL
jgi:hypothetical protein